MKKYSDMEIKRMYDRNIDMLYRISYTFFRGNISQIEDVIQDLFLKVIDKNIRFDNEEHEKYWFIVAIKNECKNVLKAKWNQEVELDFDIPEEHEEDKTNVLELVFNLPEIYKVPIYLFYYEEYSCIEIAKILDVPENTIYSYLSRGRKMLKDKMDGDDYE